MASQPHCIVRAEEKKERKRKGVARERRGSGGREKECGSGGCMCDSSLHRRRGIVLPTVTKRGEGSRVE